jgi:uncharacterized RDD family membrane protein YckC
VPPGWSYLPYPLPPPAPRPHGHTLAPYGARLVARIIDILVVFLLNAVVNGWFVWQYAREIAPVFRAAMNNPMGETPQPTARAEYLLFTILIIATALWMAYEVPAVGNTGQTLGKRIMQIKVVPVEKDERLGFGRAFRRWFRVGMWTPFWTCCGIGFVFQLIDSVSLLFDRPLRQALHDKAARTVVVEVPPERAAPTPARRSPDDGQSAHGGRSPDDGQSAHGGRSPDDGRSPDEGRDETGGSR